MFNQVKKYLDDLYQFDPATYIVIARKIIAEHERSKSALQKNLSGPQPASLDEIKDLYVKFSINRII